MIPGRESTAASAMRRLLALKSLVAVAGLLASACAPDDPGAKRSERMRRVAELVASSGSGEDAARHSLPATPAGLLRIGVVRLDGRRLVRVRPADAAAWDRATRLLAGRAELVLLRLPRIERHADGVRADPCPDPLALAARKVRDAATRQRLDAVLLYDAGATWTVTAGVLGGDLPTAGNFALPARQTLYRGAARAILFDARTGAVLAAMSAGEEAADPAADSVSAARHARMLRHVRRRSLERLADKLADEAAAMNAHAVAAAR